MSRSAPRRRTCKGFPDRPCFASLMGGNAQKRCPPCAAEADRRRKSGDARNYYQRHRQRILASANRRYKAKVEARRDELRRYTVFREWMEFLFPEREMPSLEEWRSAGMAEQPSSPSALLKPEPYPKGDTGS